MRVLYLDSLLFLELTVDTVLLWAAGKLCGAPRRPLRLLLAGLIGSLYALLTVFLPLAAALPGKLLFLLLMLLAAYGGQRRLWKLGLAYLAMSAVFAGVCCAVVLAAGRLNTRLLLFSAGTSLGLCSLPFRFAGKRGGICDVRLRGEGGEVVLRAYRDTGNRMSDPFSGCPVLIAAETELLPLFPEGTRKLMRDTREQPPEQRLASLGLGFCLLPLHTVSGSALALSATIPEGYADGVPLGRCRVVFSREEIRVEGCSALMGGDEL